MIFLDPPSFLMNIYVSGHGPSAVVYHAAHSVGCRKTVVNGNLALSIVHIPLSIPISLMKYPVA